MLWKVTAFAFLEKPRPGKFYPKKALAMGVAAGELWSKVAKRRENHFGG